MCIWFAHLLAMFDAISLPQHVHVTDFPYETFKGTCRNERHYIKFLTILEGFNFGTYQ